MTERIALTMSWDCPDLALILRAVRLADDLGYEACFLPEAWGMDAWVLLGHLAGQTRRIALGTGIVNVYSRSAAVLAMATGTLDALSGGRALLGLGASGKAVVEGWHGVPLRKPLARLRDYVAVIRKILRHDRSAYAGETVSVAPGFLLRFQPLRPRVPIYLASTTPAGIRLAGEIADGWLPIFAAPEALGDELTTLDQGLALSGRTRADVTVAPYILCNVDDDLAAARQPAREHIAFYVGGMGRHYHETVSRRGFGPAADRIKELWATRRRAEAVAAVPDELVDAIAVCGPAARCRERLQAYRRAGADLPVVSLPPGTTSAQTEATIAALAP